MLNHYVWNVSQTMKNVTAPAGFPRGTGSGLERLYRYEGSLLPRGATMRRSTESCEFCIELHDHPASRFANIYGGALPSRMVRETASFVVMPTLGQICAGSLLIVPRQHVETLAAIAGSSHELMMLVTNLEIELRSFGHPVFFEHGARSTTHGGCGIYHAHLHSVPLPRSVSASELLPSSRSIGTFSDTLESLTESSQYLIVRDAEGRTNFIDLTATDSSAYGSQYFRRRIAQILEIPAEWDWRKYTEPEPYMFQTVAAFSAR